MPSAGSTWNRALSRRKTSAPSGGSRFAEAGHQREIRLRLRESPWFRSFLGAVAGKFRILFTTGPGDYRLSKQAACFGNRFGIGSAPEIKVSR